jgi:radical S-adenosyl methionine domain-containing protein 2
MKNLTFQPGTLLDSINWHITPRCGYNCKFCNVHNHQYEVKSLECAKEEIQKLKDLENVTVKCLNIKGGDPLLHPDLLDILRIVKHEGFDIWLTTNGSLLNETNIKHFSEYIDGITIPVDCICNLKQKKMGRGYGFHVSDMLTASDMIHKEGIKLGIDTLVTKLNSKDDLHPLIQRMKPYYWNVYQTLPGLYQNSYLENISISEAKFKEFARRHSHLRLDYCNKPVFLSKKDVAIRYYFLVNGSIRIY